MPKTKSTTASEAGNRLLLHFASKDLRVTHPVPVRSISGTTLRSIPSGESTGPEEEPTVPKSIMKERMDAARARAAVARAQAARAQAARSVKEAAAPHEETAASKSSVSGGKRRSRTHRKSKRHTKRSKKRRS